MLPGFLNPSGFISETEAPRKSLYKLRDWLMGIPPPHHHVSYTQEWKPENVTYRKICRNHLEKVGRTTSDALPLLVKTVQRKRSDMYMASLYPIRYPMVPGIEEDVDMLLFYVVWLSKLTWLFHILLWENDAVASKSPSVWIFCDSMTPDENFVNIDLSSNLKM